jgi:hypothetical protein
VRIQPDGPVQIGGAQQRQREIFFSERRSLHAQDSCAKKPAVSNQNQGLTQENLALRS